ncbi:MAG TPA: porin [Candidatus Fusicatenibacter intestinipullorum]|nr:porin [Candidatus Fusicatenibacter intestinipullorum]
MKKSLVLAMAMALGVTASAYAANPFSDVPAGHWAYDAVNKLAAAGVVDGYPDGTYGGDKLMTRYEMAQIVAKAMAKGANVDKLAAEFADELDSLGVRVANLEKKSDNVKITGQFRASYKDVSGDVDGDTAALRTRLWVNGQVNEDWTYTGMFENTQTITDEKGNDDVELKRAYLEGRLGGLDVTAGRWNEVTFTGNVLDTNIDGVKVSYGDKVKVFGMAAKGASGDNVGYLNLSEDRLYIAGVTADMGAVDAYAAYFETDSSKVVGGDNMDKEIWNVGFNYNFAPDFTLAAEYMRGNEDYYNTDKDGWWADLAWKGASADEPGSYGLHVGYFDQSANAYLTPTTDGFYADTLIFEQGYKGWNVGASYAVAKNIVAVVNYYDFEAKESGEDAETIFSELYFTF